MPVKKAAIDVIYSFGVHCPEKVVEDKSEILGILDQCRSDKNQPVRMAAQETIKLLREIKVGDGA